MTYPLVIITFLIGFISALYSFVVYHKKLDLMTNLFLFFFMIDLALFFLSKTLKIFSIYLYFVSLVDILSYIFLFFWFIPLIKVGLRKTWKNTTTRKWILLCGILLAFSIFLLIIFFMLK